MSKKINVWCIISAHFRTLRDAGNSRYSKADVFTFIFFPVILSISSAWFNFNLNKDLNSLLVNFGAIFTALLLSVIVLIYDQENRVHEKKNSNQNEVGKVTNDKLILLKELYHNISYAILCSLALVVITFIHSALPPLLPETIEKYRIYLNYQVWKFNLNFDFLFTWSTKVITPLIVFITSNIILTIIMIVKRLYLILINNVN